MLTPHGYSYVPIKVCHRFARLYPQLRRAFRACLSPLSAVRLPPLRRGLCPVASLLGLSLLFPELFLYCCCVQDACSTLRNLFAFNGISGTWRQIEPTVSFELSSMSKHMR